MSLPTPQDMHTYDEFVSSVASVPGDYTAGPDDSNPLPVERISLKAVALHTRYDAFATEREFWEDQFEKTNHKLDVATSANRSILRTMRDMKRTQTIYDERMTNLESEVKSVRDSMTETIAPIKRRHAVVEGAFRKQQQDSEAFRVECLKRVDALQGIVNKLEREISVLRSQWNSNKDTINTLSEQIAPSQEATHTLTARLVEMEQKEESVWALLRETREGLEELKRSTGDEHSSLDSFQLPTLADEIHSIGPYHSGEAMDAQPVPVEMDAQPLPPVEMDAQPVPLLAPSQDGWWDHPALPPIEPPAPSSTYSSDFSRPDCSAGEGLKTPDSLPSSLVDSVDDPQRAEIVYDDDDESGRSDLGGQFADEGQAKTVSTIPMASQDSVVQEVDNGGVAEGSVAEGSVAEGSIAEGRLVQGSELDPGDGSIGDVGSLTDLSADRCVAKGSIVEDATRSITEENANWCMPGSAVRRGGATILISPEAEADMDAGPGERSPTGGSIRAFTLTLVYFLVPPRPSQESRVSLPAVVWSVYTRARLHAASSSIVSVSVPIAVILFVTYLRITHASRRLNRGISLPLLLQLPVSDHPVWDWAADN
ncbi:hypothetical protein K466DRAFT_597592 [Polyporus arcularius HHB13444]|uniref:Uncharacterized protein n=1 Tax=Polyporus arcularius HHB13444 TaxID=1314778 RepID=A0A5C3PU45_9APHY|nr:hypothetical protein K466DRAFT_597592 [Polyporus arcularius HHB13444]